MKLLIASALLLSFFAMNTYAQSYPSAIKKHHKIKTMLKTTTTTEPQTSSAGAEVSGVTASVPGDPYNLAHPFFNGDERWTNADTLYKHGDFPWALVQQHPESFRFNTESGQWETTNTSGMGTLKKTR
ncbi:MAG: hypothetical protein Q8922_13655 [Bacteroidota bacterium]|nr:hypothetical protein [Bacteroidota bacterium]MDP4234607.1 hypothetical protein [Bacteroidota bacterium]MDP4243794.1 hypothetical protein [Bacteroidota bacterium]MDP4288968.1 hypothetical protein [Bacteroidota bacterium]